jgi:hypothetical protein
MEETIRFHSWIKERLMADPTGIGIPVYDPTYGRVPPQKKK